MNETRLAPHEIRLVRAGMQAIDIKLLRRFPAALGARRGQIAVVPGLRCGESCWTGLRHVTPH